MRRQLSILCFCAFVGLLLVVPATAQTRLEIETPSSDETIEGTNVTVSFDAGEFAIVPSTVPLEEAGKRPDANRPGEGHVHLMLDTFPIVVWAQNEPYTFTNVPPGEHQLMVELVENDHSSLSPPVVQQIRFRTVSNQVLPLTGEAQDNDLRNRLVLLALGMGVLGAGVVLRRGTQRSA